LDFRFYENGESANNIRIAELNGNKLIPVKENFDKFESLINNFGKAEPQRIESSAKLADIMAGKARLMAEVIEKVLAKDKDGDLAGQMKAFKDVLIPNISPKKFADVYTQTITYGMFAARLHDGEPGTFCREKASKLIPKTNPFLRQFFQIIAGVDLDERISWIVDDLAEAFRVTDMSAVMKNFGKQTQQTDPVIHFYENFLGAYDPEERKKSGVWYTPPAIVNFIVRAVDEILQNDFKLSMGLADNSKIKIGSIEEEFHRVQILDPATGTGTFLVETIRNIHEKFRGQGGMWQSYVEQHLIPRLNGFEQLMASYAMAHINLERLLMDTGYESTDNRRLNVYLTNSLEKYSDEKRTLFAQILAREANEANRLKRDTPVMVVMGNPPYSGESKNKSEWIMKLMEDYKKEPDSDSKLEERNSKWINDDYCKFIRMGQFFIDKNSEGILAYINNHSFIDNPTFRGMRWNLMKSFDKIYIIDLHGNAKKKEVCPDGSKDENVFDIEQGVSINIFIKTGRKAEGTLAEVEHFDLYGRRKEKYDYLLNNKLSTIPFAKLQPTKKEYFFVPKDYGLKSEYDKGFSIQELFPVNSVGIVTGKDKILINSNKKDLIQSIQNNYGITADEKLIIPISYRPFDKQYIYYDTKIIERSRESVMKHFLAGENIGLMVCRQQKTNGFFHCFLHKNIVESSFVSNKTSEIGYSFPLYLYPQDIFENKEREPNLNEKIVEKISKQIGLQDIPPIDILDYIYAALHNPAYRERYKEFLKTDFPRVPYPENADKFREFAAIGKKLRNLHLLENVEPQQGIADFPEQGSNKIEKAEYINDKVWLNDKQFFDNVPREAWEFYIGGYQPAQKWLKDRKGQKLEFDDIRHYQRVICALRGTFSVQAAFP
jgi:Predicted helicase